ncbi:MAG: right-handed parallel beta-helix repeat-containing protein [Planctomycetota bacterium]
MVHLRPAVLAASLLVSGLALARPASARRLVLTQDGKGDFTGSDETPIRDAIAKAGKAGGTILVMPGTYLVRRPIRLTSGLTIEGTPQTVLRLPSPTLATAAAGKGTRFLAVGSAAEMAAGTTVEICPPGSKTHFPEDGEQPLRVKVAAVEGSTLRLAEPLPRAVPADSRIGYAHNVFFVGGSDKNITLKNLTIDGGRAKGIAMPGHTHRCAVLAHGRWGYKEGPTAPPIEDLQVLRCRIRNCYGRAVALYSVVRARVQACRIANVADEAIDFDHFCTHCVATRNEVSDAVTGVTINDGSYCLVEHNRFERCGVGVTIWWWHMCPQADLNVENTIRHNTIVAPRRAGISLGKRCHRNEVTGNSVEGGIQVVETDNIVKDNILK